MADLKSFKKLVSAMESSDNPDVRHPAAVKGVSAGDTAVGQYGLMPNTVKELANRAQMSQEDIPSDEIVKQSSSSQISDMIQNNSELMKLYVDRLTKHVMEKSQNDPESAYLRWLYGHNLPDKRVKDIKKRDPKTLQRIKSVIGEKRLMSEQPDVLDIPEEPFIDKLQTPMRKK